jgi:hypothetical protein
MAPRALKAYPASPIYPQQVLIVEEALFQVEHTIWTNSMQKVGHFGCTSENCTESSLADLPICQRFIDEATV